MPLADPESMRRAMRHWVAGVTVVTSQYQGLRHGMTVSSFTSISLIPPMILVSLERNTRTHLLVIQSGFFAVSILSVEQQYLSERFAGRTEFEEDRFSGVDTFPMISQAPLIAGSLAYMDCRVVSTVEAGTSTVFLAEIMAAESGDGGAPLAYSNRAYYTIFPSE